MDFWNREIFKVRESVFGPLIHLLGDGFSLNAKLQQNQQAEASHYSVSLPPND